MGNFLKKLLNNRDRLMVILFTLIFISRFIYSATHVIFAQDQARDAYLMQKSFQDGKILIGYGPKASVGDFYLAPFYYQLDYFLSILTGFHPLAIHFFTTLVEFFTVIIIYKIFKYFFSSDISLVGALIYAFSKLIFISSTSAWNPNMIPFFTVLTIFSFLKFYVDKQNKYIPIACLSVTIAIHLHFQSVMLLPFIGIFFITSLIRDYKNIKYWIAGGILSLVLFVPYFIEEYGNYWQNTRAIFDFINFSSTHYFDRIPMSDFIFTFFPNFIHTVLFDERAHFGDISKIIYFIGFLFLFVKIRSKRSAWIMLVFFLSIFFMLRVYKGDKNTYYLSTLYLMPPFLATILIERMRKLGIVIISLFLIFSFYRINKVESVNEYAEITQVISFIQSVSPASEVRFLFHNDDYINLFALGLSRQDKMRMNQDSAILIDVCDLDKPCEWNRKLQCEGSRGHVYSSLLKSAAGYEHITTNTFKGYRISMGILGKNIHYVNYDLYESVPKDNDILLPELYEERNLR